MEKILIILAFIVIRWLLSANKEKKKNKAKTPKEVSAPKKSVEDIFGDFMEEVNKKKNPQPVFTTNTDTHKAEEDTNKKLDWQEVRQSKFKEKEELLKVDNYKKTKTRIPDLTIKPMELIEEEPDNTFLENVDLKKAVIYKEILDRKYFSI